MAISSCQFGKYVSVVVMRTAIVAVALIKSGFIDLNPPRAKISFGQGLGFCRATRPALCANSILRSQFWFPCWQNKIRPFDHLHQSCCFELKKLVSASCYQIRNMRCNKGTPHNRIQRQCSTCWLHSWVFVLDALMITPYQDRSHNTFMAFYSLTTTVIKVHRESRPQPQYISTYNHCCSGLSIFHSVSSWHLAGEWKGPFCWC